MGDVLFQLHGKEVWRLNFVRNQEILRNEILKVVHVSDLCGAIHS